MIFKALVFIGLLSGNVAAGNALRGSDAEISGDAEHLDLEVVVGGQRKLFPLLPGTQCPPGHTCRARNSLANLAPDSMVPIVGAIRDNMKTQLAASLDWNEFNHNMDTVVKSNDYCTRRNAMARAAGLAAGATVAAVSQPAYAAQTVDVKMGSDSGQLVFVPAKTSICKGDSVKWTNNKGGPHNVVFDEDDIPSGVDQEAISMDEQLGEEGDTFSMKFDVAGTYGYYCEPHRGAGMVAQLIVA